MNATNSSSAKPLTKKAQRALEVEEDKALLRKFCPPGTRVRCVLRNVSRSGMSRRIDFYAVDPSDGDLIYLSGYIANVLDYRRHDDGGLVVGGCGMDMGFHVVYSLSRVLYRDGFPCMGEKPTRCPSNDHSNGDRDYTPGHCTHSDGGYALRSEWI